MMGLDEWWEDRPEGFQKLYKKEWFKGLRWMSHQTWAYNDPLLAGQNLHFANSTLPAWIPHEGVPVKDVPPGTSIKAAPHRMIAPAWWRVKMPKVTTDGTVTWGDAWWEQVLQERDWRWGLTKMWGGSYWGPLFTDPPRRRIFEGEDAGRWTPPQ
eukprot:TRINITY_DN68349_c0_g1_i1.p1 TRINITY_DN68349_c0_g1~~TRINITY_DN68349_c0_g1_i1.p1  ORF type:complete len:182 (-),score=15.11 TRINITY_DN68349_c0_g1_i1:97-561(-)